jgi:hypothetical protein
MKNLKLKTRERYTTEQLEAKFIVIGFGCGLVAVKDRETGEKGSFDFTSDYPRYYFDYRKHEE